jgi:hypothetical protein
MAMDDDFIAFLVKISLLFAAGMVPLMLGGKLAGMVQSKIGDLTKNAKDTAFKTSRGGAALEGRKKQKMMDAQQAYIKNRGKGGWRNPIASGKEAVGKKIGEKWGGTPLGDFASNALQRDMRTRRGRAFGVQDKELKETPYTSNYSEKDLLHPDPMVRRGAQLQLGSAGDLGKVAHTAYNEDGSIDHAQTARNMYVAADIARGIANGDTELFKTLKDNDPDALAGAAYAIGVDHDGIRQELVGTGSTPERHENATRLFKQAESFTRGSTPRKVTGTGTGTIRSLARLQVQTVQAMQSGQWRGTQEEGHQLANVLRNNVGVREIHGAIFSPTIGTKGRAQLYKEQIGANGEHVAWQADPEIQTGLSADARHAYDQFLENQHDRDWIMQQEARQRANDNAAGNLDDDE